jgi:hypothetical protein
MHVNFLFGPPSSGKTTFLNLQEYSHCNSALTYAWAELEGRNDILRARDDKEDTTLTDYQRNAARGAIINYIENYLIRRVFCSRDDFIKFLFLEKLQKYAGKQVWVSVVNEEEFQAYRSIVSDYTVYEMHRDGATYGSDLRTPPPDTETVIDILAKGGQFYVNSYSPPSD